MCLPSRALSPASSCPSRLGSQLTGQGWYEKGVCRPPSPPRDTTQKPPRGDKLSADAIQHLQVFEMKEAGKGIIPDHREGVRIQQSENKTGYNRDVVSCDEAISSSFAR